jgi:hypothetical protein
MNVVEVARLAITLGSLELRDLWRDPLHALPSLNAMSLIPTRCVSEG